MKSIKQIRELQVQLSENVESSGDVRKLTTLVRAGLFDPNKLTMLKRALNKDNVKMTRAERDALLELLDRLLTVVMANQGTFMKVKQSIQEEIEDPTEEEINEATRTDVDINQIPPLIIMKRRAIRVFPDGQKVALYWADRINKYISVPFQSIGISEQVDDTKDDEEKKMVLGPYLKRKALEKSREGGTTASTLRKMKDPVKNKLKNQSGLSGPEKFVHNIAYGIGASIRKKVLQKRLAGRIKAGAEKARDQKRMAAANAGVGHAENFRHKLAMIREQREVNEIAPLVAAAARLAPAAIRLGGAALRSRAAKKVGGALLRGGKKAAGWGKRVLGKALRGVGKVGKLAGTAALGALAGGGDNGNNNNDRSPTSYKVDRPDSPAFKGKDLQGTNPYAAARQRAADMSFAGGSQQQRENYKMIKSIAEGANVQEIQFSDGAVELSPSVAGKIVETYNALNTDNKKIVLEMINRDKNSFMKFANFASGK